MTHVIKTLTGAAIASLLFIAPAKAQGGKYGATPEDSVDCITNLSLYQGYYQQKVYEDAIGPWRNAMRICPKASKKMYIDGVAMRELFLKKEKDEATKKLLADSLYMVYDQRIEHFGQKGFVLGRKGIDMMQHSPDDPQATFDVLNESVMDRKEKSEAGVLSAYYQALHKLFEAGTVTKDQLLTDYITIMGYIERNINKPADTEKQQKIRGYYEQARDNVNEIFFRVAECADIERILGEQLQQRPDDLDLKKSALRVLDTKDCTDAGIYKSVAEDVHRANPTHESAYSNGILRAKERNWSGAMNYFKEAIKLCDDCPDKQKYLLKAGQVASASGSAGQARGYANKLLEMDPKNGEAYILIGNAILAQAGGCEEPQSWGVYWLAADYFQKAKNLDPGVAEKANSRLGTCRSRYPAKDKLFFQSLTPGASFEVSCGSASGTTTVRSQ